MTEQTTYEGTATVEQAAEVPIRYSGKPVTGSPQAMTSLHSFTPVAPKRRHTKPLAERLNEAYKDELTPEEKGLLDRAAGQLGRAIQEPGVATRQGDIFWVDLGTPLGSERGYVHPAVVVQSNPFNARDINTVVVCPTTTTPHRADDPGNVVLDAGDAGLDETSIVNVSQVIAVAKIRLGVWIGALSQDQLDEVMGGIRQVLWGEDLGL